ncbi:hypothetical protein LXL04_004272 [Taraxacum kok-saghyz]
MGLSLSRGTATALFIAKLLGFVGLRFSPATMENLSDDVLCNIFSPLPAKQLAQMRCISKFWNDLLSQPSFIKLHLDRSIRNNDGIILIFFDSFSFDSEPFTTHLTRSPYLKHPNFIKLPVNLQSKHGVGNVIGSVNGLVCFKYRSYHDSKVIYIWNPSLSALLTLPAYSTPSHSYDMIHYNFAFGFDPKENDYKVVKIMQVDNEWMQVEVYSMRKGSWKLITENIPSHITSVYSQEDICVDGHAGRVHWLAETSCGRTVDTILSFDLCAETFHKIPLPESVANDVLNENVPNIHINLGVLAGKLCVISNAENYKCEVWVMNEYGMAESWVMLDPFPQFIGDINPFGFTSKNEFLFRHYPRGLALYDSTEAKTKYFNFCIDYLIKGFKIVEYVDSLVWVKPAEKSETCCF